MSGFQEKLQTDRETDRQTDGRTDTCHLIRLSVSKKGR